MIRSRRVQAHGIDSRAALIGLTLALVSAGCPSDEPEGTGGATDAGTDAEPPDGGSAATGCMDRGLAGATDVSEDITEDTTWQGKIHLTRSLKVVNGATLTVQPGTVILMPVDSQLEVGWNSSQATLKALGTADAPIEFCGVVADAGSWGSLLVRQNVTSDSVLSYVTVSDGGGADEAALVLEAALRVDHVQVTNAGDDGVRASDFDDASTTLSVTQAEGAAVVLTHADAVTNFPLGGTLTGNGEDVARLRFGGVDDDATFHDLGVPYLQEDSLAIRGSANVELEAGVEIRFAADTLLEVGWNSSEPTFTVTGTEDDPVVFRGTSEEKGFWSGVVIRDNVRSNSKIEWLQLRHAGGGDSPALGLEAPITLRNVFLDTNAKGIEVGPDGLDASSENLNVTTTEGVPLTAHPEALVSLPEGGSYAGNSEDFIAVTGGSFGKQGTVPNLGVPYRVQDTIITLDGSSLTLTAGSTFYMAADTALELGWNSGQGTFTAVGTADAPIRFLGTDTRAGHWTGLIVRRNVTSDSKLEYVEIGNGGGGGGPQAANLRLDRPLSVRNCRFHDSAGWGIFKRADDATDYAASNTFENNASGSIGQD